MLILLDIGNTSVTYALALKGRFSSFGSCLFIDIPKKLNKWVKSGASNTINIVISSVVPKNTLKIKKWASRKPQIKLWLAGSNLPVNIRHKYKTKKKLGIDRQVNLYGARHLYGAPLLVIDYGTAIKADYLSAKGIFEGGLIIPGPELAFQALINRAALISKKIRLPKKAPSFLGRDTRECMASGILHGYGAMTDELIRRFRKRFGSKFRVISTGGFSKHLRPYTQSPQIRDPRLSIKSLLILYQELTIK